jgi:hypothetical protein
LDPPLAAGRCRCRPGGDAHLHRIRQPTGAAGRSELGIGNTRRLPGAVAAGFPVPPTISLGVWLAQLPRWVACRLYPLLRYTNRMQAMGAECTWLVDA